MPTTRTRLRNVGLTGISLALLSMVLLAIRGAPDADSVRSTPAPTVAPTAPVSPGNAAGSARRADSSLPALPKVDRPAASQPKVGLDSDSHLDKTPPRSTKGLDLVKAGWTYNCMECHQLFPARWRYDDRPFNEHKDIVLDHGNNRFCLNCHHASNRNAFADYDGAEIAQAEVVKLCAKCHGTIHRDWQAGVHGRENGFWKADLGEKTKLRCIQCHDPHSPRFKAMKPLPALRYPPRAANPTVAGKNGKSADAHH